jgi:hypothetical protein
LPPSADGGAAKHSLQRAGFIVQVTKFGEGAELRSLLEAIRSADYAAARRVDVDFVAFHCWKCDCSYCERCWRIGPPEFDEGFYDYTKAVCPQGHEQIVDD